MTEQELQQLVEDISLKSFGMKFRHKARFNPRLRTTGGRYLLHGHDIELNPKHLELFGLDELIGIIKHELCHYHLHLQKKGYRHRDADFKLLLKEVDAPRYCAKIPHAQNSVKTRHLYVCTGCGTRFERKREVDTSRYVCGKCNGRLKKIKG